MKSVNIDNQEYLCPTWNAMGKITVDLAKKIKKSKKSFDRVVALAKGGLSWNRQLQDFLEIQNTSSIQVKFYKGINSTRKRPIVIQSLPVSIEDESILIFDDIADSGESLKLAKNYLLTHGAKSISTATLFEKPWSRIKPDFVGKSTKAWVIFPHDAIENINLLVDKWGKLKKTELKNKLLKLNLEPSIINLFLASYK